VSTPALYWDALVAPGPPWAHFVACSLAAVPRLFDGRLAPLPGTMARRVSGERCLARGEFHSDWARAWQFPPKASTDWANFADGATDMGWLHASAYITVITSSHRLLEDAAHDLPSLGAALAQVAAWWANPPPDERTWHTGPAPFHVVFQCEARHAARTRARLERATIALHALFPVNE